MTVKDKEVSVTQLILMALGGACTVIIAFTGYILRDMAESMQSMSKDVSAVKAQVVFMADSQKQTQNEVSDLRAVLYDHITQTTLKIKKADK